MHILATDFLTCPRCGPDFGLVVLADRIENRQVLEGRLGCANCRSSFPIHDGTADLRHSTVPDFVLRLPRSGTLEGGDTDRGLRLAALIGAQAPNATALVLAREDLVPDVASHLSNAHLVAGQSEPTVSADPGVTAAGSVTRVLHGQRLPFRSGAFAAAAVVGLIDPIGLLELRRVLAPGARLVLDDAPEGIGDELRHRGFRVDLEQGSTVVAAVPGPG